jgi:hypothetical protein
MHEQVYEVKEEKVRPAHEVNDISEASPHQTRYVCPDGSEQNHFGVVRILLELAP